MGINKVYALILFCFFALASCTKVFYANNSSDQFQPLRIVYKTSDNCESRNSEFNYFIKKGIIRNVRQNKNDTMCVFEFELIPKRNLPLTNIIKIQDIKNRLQEERFLCIRRESQEDGNFKCDTILYKKGGKETINKFIERSKFFGFLGKKTYVYNFQID